VIDYIIWLFVVYYATIQCFDTVDWVTGRTSVQKDLLANPA